MREAYSDYIKLEDTPWEAFKLIIRYMYSGELNTSISIQVNLDSFFFPQANDPIPTLEWA